MAYETIVTDIRDHVGIIKLNRPEVLNALSFALLGELCDALGAMEGNKDVRVIVLTGNEKAFAAGADITDMAKRSFVDMYCDDCFGPEADAIRRCRKPIIAAVSGYALGGGCELAMMCDFIICSEIRAVRPAGNQPWCHRRDRRHPAAHAVCRKVEVDGNAPHRSIHGR